MATAEQNALLVKIEAAGGRLNVKKYGDRTQLDELVALEFLERIDLQQSRVSYGLTEQGRYLLRISLMAHRDETPRLR